MQVLMIRDVIYCLCMSCITGNLSGQSISKHVLGSSGTEYSNATFNLQWTLGEMSIAQLDNNGTQLDEGFHSKINSTELSTKINNLQKIQTFKVFPNPTLDIVKMPRNMELSRYNEILIYSNHGSLIERIPVIDQFQIDLSPLQAGIYYLLIVHPAKKGSISKVTKL